MSRVVRDRVVDGAGHRHTALEAGPDGGEPVLLLHGWPQFADSWSELLPVLAGAGFRALAVDQRGYAPEARPAGAGHYAVDALVADVLAFAEAVAPGRRLHLVCHDWGGMLGWVVATRYPERLTSLTVLSTPHPSALQRAVRDDREQDRDLEYVRFFRAPGGAAEASLLAGGAARLRAAYAGRIPDGRVERNVTRLTEPGALTATLNWYRGATDDAFTVPAGRITVPTLYLWGDRDAKLGRTAATGTGGFVDAPYRFEILDGASHWLPEEAPDRIGPLLLDHLTRARRGQWDSDSAGEQPYRAR